MTCHDAREQLSAWLDDALSASVRQALDTHLRHCAECPRELEQLRSTVALLGRLPPVHAPSGFVDRVMAETHRPSWSRRFLDALFRPLRVKLPLEAAAVLLVGVSALYVYQHAPEAERLARQEARGSSPAPAATPSPPAPPPAAETGPEASRDQGAAFQAKRAPSEADVPAPAAPPAGASAPPLQKDNVGAASPDTAAAKPAPMSELKPGTVPEAQQEAKSGTKPSVKKESAEPRPDTGAPATPLADRSKVAQSHEPSAPRDAAGTRGGPASAPSETAPPPPAASALPSDARGHAGGLGAAAGAAPGSDSAAGDTAPPAKSRTAARFMRASDASGRLVVPARDPAEVALDALLSRLGAMRVARRPEGNQGMVLIDVVVAAARYHELVEGLGHIGRWTTEHEPKTLPPQVRVEVAVTVEP